MIGTGSLSNLSGLLDRVPWITWLIGIATFVLGLFAEQFVKKPFEEWRTDRRSLHKKQEAMYGVVAEIYFRVAVFTAQVKAKDDTPEQRRRRFQVAVDNFYFNIDRAKYSEELTGARSVRKAIRGEVEAFERIMHGLRALPDSTAALVEKAQGICHFSDRYLSEIKLLDNDKLQAAIRERKPADVKRSEIEIAQAEADLQRSSMRFYREWLPELERMKHETDRFLSDVAEEFQSPESLRRSSDPSSTGSETNDFTKS